MKYLSALFALLLAAPLLARAPAPVSPPVPAAALLIRQVTPNHQWRWRVAPEAATQPALLDAMRRTALADAAKAARDAARDAADARKAGFPFRRYDSISDWSLAADTPQLLALAGEIYSFTGGAHGNTGHAVQIWDKAAQRSIAIDALFTDWPRVRQLIEPGFCAALAEAQRARRGTQPDTGGFGACPKLSEQPIVPYAGLATTAGQLRVLIGPYVAGPYAEGSYIITLPWPEAVQPFVKPQYRTALFGSAGG
jgi:hypothetical protein